MRKGSVARANLNVDRDAIIRRLWIDLYAKDIRENPEAYKEHVLMSPEAAAEEIIDGLSYNEIRLMIAGLRKERTLIRKHGG